MNTTQITQRYLSLFPKDESYNPNQRLTPDVLLSYVKPEAFKNAQVLHFNEKLSETIGLGSIDTPQDKDFLNAKHIPEGLHYYATAYAGHQFGNWAGQLGDGRTLMIGELKNKHGKYTELQYKGAGATPYSRHADGRAVLRSTVREYLMSEAMHHLRIPTTRSLSLSLTGEQVIRDIMYSGNWKPEPGALMIRSAESFLRFGHFEFLASTGNLSLLRKLADFVIEEYYPEILEPNPQKRYLQWFRELTLRTANLMIEWYRVGFTHGVMNTDNMSILGLTIDYGPFAMLDEYHLSFTPNTTDLPHRRYAFGAQGKIAQWNLWQLANALYPLVENSEPFHEILNDFSKIFWKNHDDMLCRKFGFDKPKEEDLIFFRDWQRIMQTLKVDYTLFFNRLEKVTSTESIFEQFDGVFYKPLTESDKKDFMELIQRYLLRKQSNLISETEAQILMQKNNPKFILRNYLLYECIQKMEQGNDMSMFCRLWEALQQPYKSVYQEFSSKRPEIYKEIPGCSMLSCSS